MVTVNPCVDTTSLTRCRHDEHRPSIASGYPDVPRPLSPATVALIRAGTSARSGSASRQIGIRKTDSSLPVARDRERTSHHR